MNNTINLDNKYIFIIIIFIIVFILTYINNYAFYEYVRIRDYQEIRSLAKNIHIQTNKCILNNEKQVCIKNIQDYLNELKPYGIVKIANIDYDNTKERHRSRVKVIIPKYLQYIESINEKLYIAKHSTPNIFFAAYRSITFSIEDILKKTSKEGLQNTLNWYLNNKIYLRSKHTILFFFLTYLIILLLRKQQQQYINNLHIKDQNIVNLSKKVDDIQTVSLKSL